MEFLVFQHVPHEHPGLISDFAKKNNIRLDIVELWKNYKIPNISDYDALIIMGGPMGVYEDKGLYPSKEDEIKKIKEAVGRIPVLGFCLGSQLLAHALGAQVYPNIQNGKHNKEIGFYEITLTPEGKIDPIFNGFSEQTKVMQWHGDAFDLPIGAQLLASSALCRNQAFNYKNAYGLLFHFEFTPEMVEKQIEVDREWIHKDFEMDEEKLKQESHQYAEQMEKQSDMLLANFLSIVKNDNTIRS